ncbi:MAG: signal peptidase II [Clostridiales bacterium]|nr:signal peptidase II [Clostridiales bacterium]
MVIIMKERIRHFIYLIILIALDQLTKFWAVTTLKENGPITILSDILKLQYHENSGAAWGIFQGKANILSIVTIFILAALFFVYIHIPKEPRFKYLKLIFVFIGAGAIGNMIDRFVNQYVVDFIYFELINFPVFNVADSYVTVAAILLIILAVFYYKDEDLAFIDQIFKGKKKDNIEG